MTADPGFSRGRGRARRRLVATGLLLAVVVGACTVDALVPGAEPVPSEVERADGPEVGGVLVATLPATLTGFATTPRDESLLVSDRRGLVWRLERRPERGAVVPILEDEPVLDLSSSISLLGERGMLGIAVTPDGSGLIVNYTALDGTITVELFPLRSGQRVDPGSGRVLVSLPHPYAWHHGGDLAFDAAGDLFVAVGDMEARQLDPPAPQDPDRMLGGVLRVPRHAIEDPDSTWEASPADMVVRGMRNPWRLGFDSETGDLWIGDVGLDTVEEIDRVPAAVLGDEVVNFGWPYFEGTRSHQGRPPAGFTFTAPVHERLQGDGVCGMVGGYLYRGESMPALRGRYVYGDLCSKDIRSFEPHGDEATDDRVVGRIGEPVVSFGRTRSGELYALGVAGGLYRLDPPGWHAPDREQTPSDPGPTTTIVERSIEGCDQMVGALRPLAEIGGMDGPELRDALEEANGRVEELIPSLPPEMVDDAVTVQNTLLELTRRLEEAGWSQGAAEVQALREEMLQGSGFFAGFPEAMARVVDAECG